MKKVDKKKNTNDGISPVNRFNILYVNIQIILTIVTVIFGVLYLFNTKMKIYFEMSLISDLFIMAINNQLIFKRSKMTIVYLIVAIILLICMVI